MKTKLLFCFITLGFLSAAAQFSIRQSEKFYQAQSPHPIVKQVDALQNCISATSTREQVNIARSERVTHQVDFMLNFDTETQRAKQIKIINNDFSAENSDCGVYELINGSNVMSIPEGTYDIIVSFYQLQSNGWMPKYIMYVIREQVTIDHDMILNFATNEAKNHINFQTLTIDGEPVNTGKWFIDENGNKTPLEEGNTDDVIWFSYLINKDYGCLEDASGFFGSEYEGSYQSSTTEQLADFYVNDVSDRYVFYSYRVAYKGSEVYTSSQEVQGATNNIIVSNDPSDFTLYEDYFPSPGYENDETYITFAQFCEKQDDANFFTHYFVTTLPQPQISNEKCKYYIGMSANTSQIGIVPMIQPARSYAIKNILPWGEIDYDYQPIMTSMPLTKKDGQIEFVNNGIDSDRIGSPFSFRNTTSNDEHSFEFGNIYRYLLYPGHPAFTYSVNHKKGMFLNNCPIIICCPPEQKEIIDVWEDEEGNEITYIYCNLYFLYDYIGRYGEKKISNAETTDIDIKANGETIYSGKGKNFIQLDELINGEVDATIINETFFVDDMVGSNKAQLHYIAGAEDENPPTLTMLHFKDSNDDVNDRFATASEGTLEFSAADYNRSYTEQNWQYYNRYAPESVEVSYSPYCEDNWNELAIEEVPENYWPMMGWFYTGSLASVTGYGLKGWFDLKIRLTDAAGNWQEQVISPAFRIEDQSISAINTVHDTNAHEVARYNTAGQRVDANTKGIIIVKMSDGSARKIFSP